MDQGEAYIKRRGPVEELHLVSGELPGDVATGWLVGFYCRQVSLHHACSKERKEGQKMGDKRRRWNVKMDQCLDIPVQLLSQEFMYTVYWS